MSTPETPQSPRRRRKRREARGVHAAVVAFTNSGGLTRTMMILTAAFLLISAGRIYQRLGWYGDSAIGDAPAMVLYTMGTPSGQTGSQGSQNWHYRNGSNRIVVGFSGERVSRITCRGQPGSTTPCPEIFGITDRSGEYDVLVTLGHPDRVIFEGELKVAHYDALGLSFGYARRQVRMVQAANRQEDFVPTLVRYLRILVP